jgi:hypothetical protein
MQKMIYESRQCEAMKVNIYKIITKERSTGVREEAAIPVSCGQGGGR